MKKIIYQIAIFISPKLFFSLQHFRIHKKYGSHFYRINLKNPRTFNEKILYSKLIRQHDGLYPLVDKESVKEIVGAVIGQEYIIPTQMVVNHELTEDNIKELNPPFIMKPTHLSGLVMLVVNFEDFDLKRVNKWIRKSLKGNLHNTTGEQQYKGINPKIIIENSIGTNLLDYKFFCFHGKVHFIQVDHDRHTFHTRSFYTRDWDKLNISTMYPIMQEKIKEPEGLSQMISIAEKLSKSFDFLRVDLYYTDGQIYFGELTFHHGSGYEPFTTYRDDLFFGDQWKSFYKYDSRSIDLL